MQGMDLTKLKGGRKRQQQVAQAVAMESANRVLTRRALEVLKSIATGEYRAEQATADMIAEGGPVQTPEETPVENVPPTETESAPAETSPQGSSGNEAETKSE
jgi:hypothetical protein